MGKHSVYKEDRDEALRLLKISIAKLKTDSYILGCIPEAEALIEKVTGETLQLEVSKTEFGSKTKWVFRL